MLANSVQETTSTTGTGTLSLSGAPTGRRTFVQGFGSGETALYTIEDPTTGAKEIGWGVVTSGTPDTLTRATVIWSTNSNALVNFASGTKNVFCAADADAIRFGAAQAPVATGTANARAVAYKPAVTRLVDGRVYPFVNGNAANSGALTLDLGPGGKSVRRPDGTATSGDEAPANQLLFVMYRQATDELWFVNLPVPDVAAMLTAQAIKQGRHTIWVPAGAMVARTTNGAASGSVETTTNKVMLKTLDFDASTIEYAQFAIRMPKGWDEGTVSAVFEWSHAATTTNFKVSWGLQAVAISDDDALDAAFGTAQYANDDGGTTNDAYASPETSAITIAGTPAAEDLVIFQVLRKADDGTNDTLAIDARLHGVTLYITINAPTDA